MVKLISPLIFRTHTKMQTLALYALVIRIMRYSDVGRLNYLVNAPKLVLKLECRSLQQICDKQSGLLDPAWHKFSEIDNLF